MNCPTGYQVSLTGTLIAAPSLASDDAFPAGNTQIPFATNPNPKPANVSTGDMQATVSNQSFAALPGVGPQGIVTQGTLLFFRSNAAIQVRTTTYNALENVQAIEVVNGLKVVEYDPDAYLVLVEVLGQGVIEYFASGPL